MSKRTATASTIQIAATTPVLMLALELGEEAWKLGFSSRFGQVPLVRDIGSHSTKALLAQIAWSDTPQTMRTPPSASGSWSWSGVSCGARRCGPKDHTARRSRRRVSSIRCGC